MSTRGDNPEDPRLDAAAPPTPASVKTEDLSEYFDQEAFAEEIAKFSQEPEAKTTVSDLQSPQICPPITVRVHSLSRHGLSQTVADRRLYFTFLIADDTGRMECTAFEPHAAPLSRILERGATMDITGGVVKKIEPTALRYADHHYDLSLTETTAVKVHKHGEVIYTHSPPRAEVPQKVEVEVPRLPEFTSANGTLRSLENINQRTISALNFPHRCSRIEMKVKSVITVAPFRSKTGKSFFRFVGYDDTGEICCTAFEPLALQLGDRVAKDATLEIKNGQVMRVEGLYPRHCQNQYEMKLFKDAEVKILRESTSSERNLQLKSLDELRNLKLYDVADIAGVLAKSELSSRLRNGVEVPYRELSIKDQSDAVVTVALFGEVATDFAIPTGAAVTGRKLQVRTYNNRNHLLYTASSSIERAADGGENRKLAKDEKSPETLAPRSDSFPGEPPAKKPCLDTRKNIADLTFPHVCPRIRLKIKQLVTPGPAVSRSNKYYHRFLAHDDTGEICCTAYEPHSLALADVAEGATLDVANATVKPVEGLYDTHCDNKFELKLFQDAQVAVLSCDAPREDRGRQLESLAELRHCRVLEIVDVVGVLLKSELSTRTKNNAEVPYRELSIVDTSDTTAIIALFGKAAADFGIPRGAVICGRKLQVRSFNNENRFLFVPGSSIDRAIGSEESQRLESHVRDRTSAPTETGLNEGQTEGNATDSSRLQAPADVVTAPAANKLSIYGVEKKKIADLTSPQICPLIRITVKSLITTGPAISKSNKFFFRFVGCDDTGEICCTAFEPLALIFAEDVTVGTVIDIRNATVKPVDDLFDTHCAHKFQVKLFNDAKIMVVKQGAPVKKESPQLTDLAELRNYNLYDVVDVAAFLVKSELLTSTKNGQDIPYRQVTVSDLSNNTATIVMFGEVARDFAHEPGAVISGKQLQVRLHNGVHHLLYGPLSSICEPSDEETQRLRESRLNSAHN